MEFRPLLFQSNKTIVHHKDNRTTNTDGHLLVFVKTEKNKNKNVFTKLIANWDTVEGLTQLSLKGLYNLTTCTINWPLN